MTQNADISLIGQYGKWATSLANDKVPALSFRRKEFNDLSKWHQTAEAKAKDRISIPDIGAMPEVTVKKQYIYDGLHIEELSWTTALWPAYRCDNPETFRCKRTFTGDYGIS